MTTNLDLKQHKRIILRLQRQSLKQVFIEQKLKGIYGKTHFLDFSSFYKLPTVLGSSPLTVYSKSAVQHLQIHSLFLSLSCFYHHISFSDCFPPLRTLCLCQAHPTNPKESPHLKILITSTKSSLPCKVTYATAAVIRMWPFWG